LPKKTIATILEGGNDYLIQVKGNRKLLHEAVKKTEIQNEPISETCKIEKNRGRDEKRIVRVYEADVNDLEFCKWEKINKIIILTSSGTRKGKNYEQKHYYITSRTEQSATYYTNKIREHWGIENRSHWVKDVIMNEDGSLIRNLARSKILSSVRCLVVNIFRLNNYQSVKYGIEKHQNNLPISIELII